MFKYHIKGNKGFTLIELIVVIAILGILSSILVPKFGGFTEKSKIRADEATLKILNDATQLLAVKKNQNITDFTAKYLKENGKLLEEMNLLDKEAVPQSKADKFTWHQREGIWSLDNTMFSLSSLKNNIASNGTKYSDPESDIQKFWPIEDDVLQGKGTDWTSDHRVYFPTTSTNYAVEVTAQLDKYNNAGYGVLIDTSLTGGDTTKNTGYSVQFDPGANQSILIRSVNNGEYDNDLGAKPLYSIPMKDVFGNDYEQKMKEKHTLKVDVKNTEDGKRTVDLYIKFDGDNEYKKINANDKIELKALETDPLDRHVGIRTWKGNTVFYDYKVIDQ